MTTNKNQFFLLIVVTATRRKNYDEGDRQIYTAHKDGYIPLDARPRLSLTLYLNWYTFLLQIDVIVRFILCLDVGVVRFFNFGAHNVF